MENVWKTCARFSTKVLAIIISTIFALFLVETQTTDIVRRKTQSKHKKTTQHCEGWEREKSKKNFIVAHFCVFCLAGRLRFIVLSLRTRTTRWTKIILRHWEEFNGTRKCLKINKLIKFEGHSMSSSLSHVAYWGYFFEKLFNPLRRNYVIFLFLKMQ